MTLSNTFVCLMGLGTVFVGLLCIVCLCELMHYICQLSSSNTVNPAPQSSTPAPKPISEPIPNREQLLAAVTAVLAEELGTDITGIRVHSFRVLP